ncbi:MAG: hypothetical protein PHU49_08640 [Syntrophorhabdaceae bacterium]|nr:hypothetical protein [Syntrophorhabdaceae bacterium]
MDMLNIMAHTGKINKDLWLKYNIIYSEDLVNSISDAYRKRENKPITKDVIPAVYGFPAEDTQFSAEEISGKEISGGKNQQTILYKRKEKKRSIVPTGNINQEFLTSLKNNPAYKHINIEMELAKMDQWLLLPKNKNRKKTPRFILNWLNKIESPIEPEKKKYFSTVADIEKEEREHGIG